MSRVLWLGDAGCHTGFARVTHGIGDRLARDFGHEIHTLAINHKGDYWPTDMRLYVPTMRNTQDIYGMGRVPELLAMVEPEAVVILNDPAVVLRYLFQNPKDPERFLLQTAPILAYLPIDGENNPPIWDVLGKTTTRVAMSKHGQAAMAGSELVYHGVDTDTYYPATNKTPIVRSDGQVVTSKATAKRSFGFDPDSFLVLRVDRNSRRKNYADTWRALVPVMKRHTDVIVWFHCMTEGDELDILPMLGRDPDTAGRFFYPGQYNTFKGWPDNDLAALYNAADVFVTTSWGEGFGLTIAEALAAGTPVIAQNFSAIPEVVGPGGILIDPERPMTVYSGQDQRLPNVGAFSEAIEHLYGAEGYRRKLGAKGRVHVRESFSWDAAARRFDELISGLAAKKGETDSATAVQHHDEGPDDQGAGGRTEDPVLHSV